MDVQRAYAAFEVKEVDEKRRIFRGWATTPAVDRVGDTINPMGVRFKNPLALLHQHRHDSPIGQVTFDKPTTKGVKFEAEIPIVEEPGLLKDRLDLAWSEIKYGLVRAVSIGFRPIKYSFKDNGGVDYQETEVYELSAVTIPALPDAVITSVKSMSGPLSAAMIQQIKGYDRCRVNGGIPLISVKSERETRSDGSVRLVLP